MLARSPRFVNTYRSGLHRIALLLLLAGWSVTAAAQPPVARPFAQHAYERMLTAIVDRSYDAFVALGDGYFKTLRQEDFERVHQYFAPLLAGGQRSTYLGSFSRKDTTIHYWRLSFSGDENDWLAKLAIKDEHVSGFFISPP